MKMKRHKKSIYHISSRSIVMKNKKRHKLDKLSKELSDLSVDEIRSILGIPDLKYIR